MNIAYNYHIPCLEEILVVAIEIDWEDDAGGIRETIYPLSSFTSLPTHIHDIHRIAIEVKFRFWYTRGPYAVSHDILLTGDIRTAE